MDEALDYLDQVNTAAAEGDIARAAQLADQALRAGVRHPLLMRLVAEDMERNGKGEAAVAFLNRGLVLMPNDPTLLTGLAGRLANLDRTSDAVRMFEAAIKADPSRAEPHFQLGGVLAGQGFVELARSHFERAAALDPTYADAHAALALLLARTGETAAARQAAERALAGAPEHVTGGLALGLVEVGERRFDDAEARLNALAARDDLTAPERAAVDNILGDVLDGEGRIAEAFDAYTRSNIAFQQIFAGAMGEKAANLVPRLTRLANIFETQYASRWSPVPLAPGEAPSGVAGHAFLVGFPRSGTTLLEQVLAAHPDVVTLEEQPALLRADIEFLRQPGGVERLAAITPERAAEFRRSYWDVVADTGGVTEGKMFVDKMPMNSAALPVVAKLFPGAKILFARRDPRDVILSCYRRAFMANPSTYLMLTLEGAAELYGVIMRLTELYREKLPLPVREVRYEDFVTDFETEARAICDFLGVPWNEDMTHFAAKAAQRTITTPSAIQVRRGIYRGGEGQWRRYADQLAPVLPALAPWIEPKGYASA